MNETVVGTVNREIRMSGQIITSIQENMELINNPKVDTGYLMVPAHNIGGEFVDLIRLTDSRHIFVIGSVSGKGIAASMSMVILKSIIRTFLAETTDFKKLVAKVNAFVRDNLPKGIFFSGTFGLMDFASNTMYYINCGSPAIFVYSKAYNNVIEVQGEGHILGFVKDITPYVKVKKIKLTVGDIVFICTDGLIDSRSLRGDIFSKSRVSTAITENQTYTADRLAKFTYESLKSFTSKELEDDITILVFKYVGGNK
jgi:serine phosphatase RsbU (regulator of sigma subunit)